MMRKLFVALLVGAMAVGLAAPAFAADLKFTGAYRVRFQFDDNHPCVTDTTDCSGHRFETRFKPVFTVETEGGVRGVLQFEIGDIRFGNSAAGAGGGAGADGTNVETAAAYIDFPVPATPLRLRAGVQHMLLSKALFLDDDFSGLSLYGKLGEINANFFWVRANSPALVTPAGTEGTDARDLYALDLAFSPMRDLNLNGYLVYDHDMESPTATGAATGYWIGVAGAGRVQNIRWDLDFVYGTKEISATADKKGWGLDGGAAMTLPGSPLDLELRGWYFTGNKGDGGDNEGFPVLYAGSGGHNTGAQIWTGAAAVDMDELADSPENTWAIGLIARYTVNPNLRLTGNIHYIGTQEEGTVGTPAAAGDGTPSGVDSIGTEFGLRVDYTLASRLVFTLTGSYLSIGDDLSIDGVTRFDDVTKFAGILNYGF